MNIISEEHNKLLNRKELVIEISFTAQTPSNIEMQKQIAENKKVDEKLVIVKQIQGIYGDKRAKVIAYIYDDIKSLTQIEPKPKEKKEKKEKPAKPEKPAEAPKQPPAEEKPKEEPKPEEKPAEEKK